MNSKFLFNNYAYLIIVHIVIMLSSFRVLSNDGLINQFQTALSNYESSQSLQNYTELRSAYLLLEEKNESLQKRWMFAQQMAAIDTFFGRYIDAEQRLYKVRPNYGKARECPDEGYESFDAIKHLGSFLKNVDVLLINESHSRLATRSFNLQLLKTLKFNGFTHIAIEALANFDRQYNQEGKKLTPRGDGRFGYYTTEPIMAEIIREVQRLGMKLVEYDDFPAGGREAREESQATNIATLINNKNDFKVAVLAGYSHIYKNQGWMAERLSRKVSKKLLSVDQVKFLNGCSNFNENSKYPFLVTDKEGNLWSDKPERVDISLLHKTVMDKQTGRPLWLRYNKAYKPIKIDISECTNTFPCLISIFYSDEKKVSTPAAVRYLKDSSESSWVYLLPGRYNYQIENKEKTSETRMFSVLD